MSTPKEQRAPFIGLCNKIRDEVGRMGTHVLATKHGTSFTDASTTEGADSGEMVANLMLAYRHLEDARMRLGKAIQASEGGVSVFDKPAVQAAL